MNLRILAILFSLTGISATFMPWLHFPRSGTSLYGYVGDGVVSGLAFFIIFILLIRQYKKAKPGQITTVIVMLLSFLMTYMAVYKLITIEAEKKTFSTDNPLLAAAFAGAHQGIGIYVLGISGAGIFLLLFLQWLQNKTSNILDITGNNGNIKKRQVGVVISVLLVLFTTFGGYSLYRHYIPKEITTNVLRSSIETYVEKMGQALINGDYKTFVDYNHIVMQQSLGGKEKLTELVKSTMEGMKSKDIYIESIKLEDIITSNQDGNKLQAVITQKVTFIEKTGSKTEIQKLLAVSENKGKSWDFINISNKTKNEIQQIFPDLMKNLTF